MSAPTALDHERIVQVGNLLDFGNDELLSQTHADETADVSAVIEGNLSANMRVVGVILDHFVVASIAASRGVDALEENLRRIIQHTAIGEITIADRGKPGIVFRKYLWWITTDFS